MIQKNPLCIGHVYRGVVSLTIRPNTPEAATVVVGAVNGQDVKLFECNDEAEARALIDAALLLTALPVHGFGGARAVGLSGNGSTRSV